MGVPHGGEHVTGPLGLARDVVRFARDAVTEYLIGVRRGPEAREAAVESWGWLIGRHEFRLPASVVYGATDQSIDDVVTVLSEQFEQLNPKRFRKIDQTARKCSLWVIAEPTGVEIASAARARQNKVRKPRSKETRQALVAAIQEMASSRPIAIREAATICGCHVSTIRNIISADERFAVVGTRKTAKLWRFKK